MCTIFAVFCSQIYRSALLLPQYALITKNYLIKKFWIIFKFFIHDTNPIKPIINATFTSKPKLFGYLWAKRPISLCTLHTDRTQSLNFIELRVSKKFFKVKNLL